MIGTIFYNELLLAGRRNRLFAVRCFYAGLLVAQVFGYAIYFQIEENQRAQMAWMQSHGFWPGGGGEPPFRPRSAPPVVGGWFAQSFVPQHFALLAIATPALVAGAVADEKRRGTLQALLLADVSTRALLFGKLLARVAQVAVLALVGLPLFALLGGFGGVPPAQMLAVGYVSALTVLAVAAMALLASVWCRQTRDAVVAVYAVGAVGGLAVWLAGGVLDAFDPFRVVNAAVDPAGEELARRLALATLAWGGVGGACLAVAAWRLVPVYLRDLENPPVRTAVAAAGPRADVGDDPVLWRERYLEGLAPARGLRRVPRWLAVAALALATTVSSACILGLSLQPGATAADVFDALHHFDFGRVENLMPRAADGFWVQGVTTLLLASLVVGVRCSGAVTAERERQTWEPLLLTALTGREIVDGKLWGVMGASYRYLAAAAVPTVLLSLFAGPLATFWAVACPGATLVAMYNFGANGVWASAASQTSWQALLKTLLWAFFLGALANVAGTVVMGVGVKALVTFVSAFDLRWMTALARAFVNHFSSLHNIIFAAICLSLAVVFRFQASLTLKAARRLIAEKERTRQWPSEPVYRRLKRRPAVTT